MSALANTVYRFAGCELDPREHMLLVNGQPVTLTPKAFETLVLLVERAGQLESRDELMTALWPRGFVNESTLSKNVWLIRKALGDSEQESRYIETVPKVGYRFIAPVTCAVRGDARVPLPAQVAEPPSAAAVVLPFSGAEGRISWTPGRDQERWEPAHHEQAQKPEPRRHLLTMLATGALLCALAGVLVWRVVDRESTVTLAPGTKVAIVDFNNLSRNDKDGWLAPALSEMLTTELAVGDTLHALPDELVRPARIDLKPPLAGGYSPQSLATLRKRLDTDYVLSGSYLISGLADAPQLRIDLALQDARNGRSIVNIAKVGPLNDLPALVTGAGEALREKLDYRPASADELKRVAAAQPPNINVVRKLGSALDALHRYDPARARDELLEAVTLAPDYALTYIYLSQAWDRLGYKEKAKAAIGQAAAHSAGLPEEQRLQIEAQLAAADNDFPHAIQAYARLEAANPEDAERRFQLIDILLENSRLDEVDTALAELRKLPGEIQSDPRVEIAAARVAGRRSEMALAGEHGRNALDLARTRDDLGLIAESYDWLGAAERYVGMYERSESDDRSAIDAYRRIGNPVGEAIERMDLGDLMWKVNRRDEAQQEYQRALTSYQQLGNQRGIARTYARMFWVFANADDLDKARKTAQQVVDLSRVTGDVMYEAFGLYLLAESDAQTALSDDALAEYREIIALDEHMGTRLDLADYRSIYAAALTERGVLVEAHENCQRAQANIQATDTPIVVEEVDSRCASVELASGDVDRARGDLEEALKSQVKYGNVSDQPDTEERLSQIDMALGHWESARDRLQHAIGISMARHSLRCEPWEESAIALCYQALGDDTARNTAAARARELRAHVNSPANLLALDANLALLRGEMGEREAAVAELRRIAAEQEHRQFLRSSLDTKLKAWQLLDVAHDPAAPALRREIETTAQQHGYQWILDRLTQEPKLDPAGPHERA